MQPDGSPARWGPRSRRIGGDIALAAAVFMATALIDVYGPDHRGSWSIGWDLALAAPLVLRRSYPEVAAAAVGLVCLAQWQWGPPVMGDIAALVMLYTLGTRATGRRRGSLVVAVLVTQVGVVMAVTRWQPASTLPVIIMLTGTLTASWVAGIYVRTRRAYTVSLLERAENAERERHIEAQMAVAAERARIARELHDVVAHSLSVMITLNDAAAAVGTPGRVRDTVEQASEVGRQALAEMHLLLGVLRQGDRSHDSDDTEDSDDLVLRPTPTTSQLADLASLVRSAGLDVDLRTTGDLAAVSPSAQLAVYRIVQESLTNVLKHGRNVDKVVVVVSRHDDRLEVSVVDDGESATSLEAGTRGQPTHGAGLGLAGMRERAQVFGGTVEAGPVGNRGWKVATTLLLTQMSTTQMSTRTDADTAAHAPVGP